MKIGEVARAAGIAPSAIRYYERAGLLPRAPRVSRQRCYDVEILGYLEIIRTAREAGLGISETRELMCAGNAKPSERWRSIAARKQKTFDALEEKLRGMRATLDSNFRCECATLQDCARGFARKRRGLPTAC